MNFPVLRHLLLVLVIVVAAAGSTSEAVLLQRGAEGRQGTGPNTWTARSTTGLTIRGTWTAVIDEKSGAVTGAWALTDAKGRTTARGAWSAAKNPAGWSGAWRAVRTGSKGEYAGSWSARVDLAPDAPFARLFEKAAQTVVSGAWTIGRRSGGWSIRAFD